MAALAVGTASVLAFILLALLIPAGLPYDEPSHFGTVQFYGQNHAMPKMGDPGVTYEAQMGPVYYTGAAAIYEATESLSTQKNAFYATRLAGVVPWIMTLFLAFMLFRRLIPDSPWVVFGALTLFALNPALLVVVSSVQNDGLAIALSMLTLVLTLNAIDRHELTYVDAVLLGVIAAAAVLTKVHTLLLVGPAFASALIASRTRYRIRIALIWLGTLAALAGWWFVRNLVVYGDLTGHRGVARTGVDFPAAKLTFRSVRQFATSAFGYLWTPVEYFRNTIKTPTAYKAAVGLFTALALIGLARLVRSIRRPQHVTKELAVAFTAASLIVGVLISNFTVSSVSVGRLLYPLFALFALGLAVGYAAWGRRVGSVLVVVTVIGYAFMLASAVRDVRSLPHMPFELAFGQ